MFTHMCREREDKDFSLKEYCTLYFEYLFRVTYLPVLIFTIFYIYVSSLLSANISFSNVGFRSRRLVITQAWQMRRAATPTDQIIFVSPAATNYQWLTIIWHDMAGVEFACNKNSYRRISVDARVHELGNIGNLRSIFLGICTACPQSWWALATSVCRHKTWVNSQVGGRK